MPTTYKILGQVEPTANVTTTLYECPNNTQSVVSTIIICNTTSSAIKCRVSVRPGSETLSSKHYICYNTPVLGNDLTTMTLGISLSSGATIEVHSQKQGLSFSCFGMEIT